MIEAQDGFRLSDGFDLLQLQRSLASQRVLGRQRSWSGTLGLAVCYGGTQLSHVNDAGVWMVNQYFGMTVPQTLRSLTAMKDRHVDLRNCDPA